MEKVLKDIRNAEAKARKIISDAEARKAGIITKASQDSIRLINEKKEEINRSKDRAIAKKAEELEKKREGILEAGRKEADAIGEKAFKNLKQAKEFVFGRLKEEMEQ